MCVEKHIEEEQQERPQLEEKRINNERLKAIKKRYFQD